MLFRAVIKEGRLRSKVLSHLIKEAKEGEVFWFEVKNDKPKRTTRQNSLYWLYLTIISDETGNSKEDLHEYFKLNLLGYETHKILTRDGKEIEFQKLRSTTKLSKQEFSEYMDRIERLTGIPIPDVNEFEL